MDRERLQRIRNFQSTDFYPALFMRPLTIGVLLVVGDWKFLTPNRLTTLANIVKLAAAWSILHPDQWLLSAILLNLGLLFDHLDGTLARYRRTFTKLGSFYDKTSDMVTWWPITLAIGWTAYVQTGEAYYIVLATTSATAMNVRAYMKWLAQAESERLRWFEARENPAEHVAKRTQPIVIKPPPVRTPREWARWFVARLAAIVWFEEMDLWLWVTIGVVIDRLDLLCWMMFATQTAICLGVIVWRHVEMARLDRKLREVETKLVA